MENTIKRPTSVWIAQILLIIFSLIFLLPFVMLLITFGISAGGFPLIGLVIALAINLLMVSLLLIAFWGMVRRQQYGRWIGVAMLSLMLFFSVVGQIVRPAGPMQYYEYENATQAAAGL